MAILISADSAKHSTDGEFVAFTLYDSEGHAYEFECHHSNLSAIMAQIAYEQMDALRERFARGNAASAGDNQRAALHVDVTGYTVTAGPDGLPRLLLGLPDTAPVAIRLSVPDAQRLGEMLLNKVSASRDDAEKPRRN